MTVDRRNETLAYGVRVLFSNHREIRKLKRVHSHAVHGTKQWASSWVLMDYIDTRGLRKNTRLMEIGCGWGLAGIYCAKRQGARVTAVDMDPDVFPYLRLHAGVNGVEIGTLVREFDHI